MANNELSIGALEVFSFFDQLYEEDMNSRADHNIYCPCHANYSNPHKFSTLCLCKELDKADREAYLEDKADDMRKYGEI